MQIQPSRDLDVDRRRGHVTQPSISDPSLHVTDAIAHMYGDNDWKPNDKRRPSYSPSPPEDGDIRDHVERYDEHAKTFTVAHGLARSPSKERHQTTPNGSQHGRTPSFGNSPTRMSAPPLTRTPSSDTANQRFPLNDIDYESSPAAVAQELSNLQAIRRMSMNTDAADPDFPSFTPSSPISVEPPSPTPGEDETTRLFWVPARLHPELAPKEFKTFVEDRVDRIKRRAGSEDMLSPMDVDRHSSNSNLQRRKSRLSKTIESAAGYEDGAEILERRRSQPGHQRKTSETTLQELEHLVNDRPESISGTSVEETGLPAESQDGILADEVAIIPPGGALQSLKRSTRTNYRRGSLKKGERVPFSRRAAGRKGEGETEDFSSDFPQPSSFEDVPPQRERIQSDFYVSSGDNELRHGARKNSVPTVELVNPSDESKFPDDVEKSRRREEKPPPTQTTFHSRIAKNGRTTAPIPGYKVHQTIPQIVETPPPSDTHQNVPAPVSQQILPERKSSHDLPRVNTMQTVPIERRSRPGMNRTTSYVHQTLDDMANRPSLMPGTNTRTDAVTFIPTLTEDKKTEKKPKDKKDSGESSSKKSSWSWLLGGEEKDKSKDKKEKEKEKEEKESVKKAKSKASKVTEKAHDSARLDLLHTAVEGPRGRESLVLDRESIKIDDERKKEGGRKVFGGDGKKEKESSLFSTLFGGGKRKTEREQNSKKAIINRGRSPDPPYTVPRADVDYNWTRFSILEERAIYRMAHIKLANPRRALYSQVLLSNFMYSYLAKVQQMHPQIQIPQFVSQKQQQQQQQQQQSQRRQSEPPHGYGQEQQVDEFAQWQRYQAQHDHGTGYDIPPSNAHSYSSHTNYIDDYDSMEHQQQQQQQGDGWSSSYQQPQQQQLHDDGGGGGGGEGSLYNTQHHAQQQQQQQQHNPHDPTHWEQRDRYSQQGHFGKTRPPEEGEMW